MAKLTYRNESGDTLTFGDKAPFLITKIEGLGSPKNEIHKSKSPYQDGTTITHATLEERELVLEGVILYAKREERQRYRDRLIKVFNPKLKGELIFERDGTKKKIECVVEQAPYFPSNMQEPYQMFSLIFICPDPFWQDINTTKEEVAIWRGAFEFPLELTEEGIEMGYREPSLIVNIFNKGDVACGMRIQFKAIATVVNPSLLNVNTGEYFKLNKTMQSGETITVTTHFQNKKIEVNQGGNISNGFIYLDVNSTFLQLEPGDNVLRYNADEGIENLEITIWYTPQYLGV